MKTKTKICTICAAVIVSAFYLVTANHTESVFSKNIEALCDSEGVLGHCQKEAYLCMFVCPKCGAEHEVPGLKGPAYDVHGHCLNCGEKIDF